MKLKVNKYSLSYKFEMDHLYQFIEIVDVFFMFFDVLMLI